MHRGYSGPAQACYHRPTIMHRHDVLILGSGLAALTTALKLGDQRRVAIVTKRQMSDGASDWAQGGIAAAVDSGDSAGGPVHDTPGAGARPCGGAGPRQGARPRGFPPVRLCRLPPQARLAPSRWRRRSSGAW